MRKELRFGLILSVVIFTAVMAIRYKTLKDPEPEWSKEYSVSLPVSSLAVAEKDSIANCDPTKNPEKCDEAMQNLQQQRYNAELFDNGFDFCLEKFGLTAKQCRQRINGVHSERKFKNRNKPTP